MYNWIDKSFTKFNMLNLIEYDKVIQLDADMIAIRNLDELFELSTPAGICTGVSGREEENQRNEKRNHGRLLDEGTLQRSLRFWGIRGCMYLISPNRRHYKDMLAVIYKSLFFCIVFNFSYQIILSPPHPDRRYFSAQDTL